MLLIVSDITNLIQKLQALELNSNTSINALKATMHKQGWIFKHKVDAQTSCLTYLFIASKACLKYAQKHPDILIIDATYKTNCFKMLLLNIISKLLSFIQILF